MEQINLGDKRLEARAIRFLNNLGSKPRWAET